MTEKILSQNTFIIEILFLLKNNHPLLERARMLCQTALSMQPCHK